MTDRIYRTLYGRNAATLALVLALAAALVAGLDNVAHGFAQVKPDAPVWLHYLSAVAIEAGVVAIGLVIAVRARQGDNNWRLFGGIVLFVVISALVNYDVALSALLGDVVTWPRILELDRWTLAKAGALGGALPVMVLFVLESLRELGTSDAPRRARTPLSAAQSTTPAQTTGKPSKRRRARAKGSPERLAELLDRDPNVTAADAARVLGISRPTVYRWADDIGAERADNGQWKVNGAG